MSEYVAYSQSRHPAPYRDRISLAALFYGMFAAPIAWAGNLMVTFALANHACYPGFHPLGHVLQGFGFVWTLMLAFYLLALLICVSGFLVAFRAWRITAPEKGESHIHHLVETGDGRSRYFALIGMASGVQFFWAPLLGPFAVLRDPLCVH